MPEPHEPVDDGSGQDALRDLLCELRAYEVLSHAEHLTLIAAAQAGDRDAMDRMVSHNLRLVVNFARRRIGQGVPLLDLVSEGALGLKRAVEKYRLDSGRQFSTYASYWIRQAIGRAIEKQGRVIRIPSYANQQLRRVQRALENDYDARQKAVRELAWEWEVVSLDAPLHPDDPYDSDTLADLIADPDAPPPSADRVANEQLLLALINRAELTWRELAVLTYRYGLDGGGPRTLELVAARLPSSRQNGKPLTRERVRQIELAALRKLRAIATHSEDRDALIALVA